MTAQAEAALVAEVQSEPQALVERAAALPIWQVGKVYWCRNHFTRILILTTKLRGPQPIGGAMLDNDGKKDELYQFTATGRFTKDGDDCSLDLSTDIV